MANCFSMWLLFWRHWIKRSLLYCLLFISKFSRIILVFFLLWASFSRPVLLSPSICVQFIHNYHLLVIDSLWLSIDERHFLLSFLWYFASCLLTVVLMKRSHRYPTNCIPSRSIDPWVTGLSSSITTWQDRKRRESIHDKIKGEDEGKNTGREKTQSQARDNNMNKSMKHEMMRETCYISGTRESREDCILIPQQRGVQLQEQTIRSLK